MGVEKYLYLFSGDLTLDSDKLWSIQPQQKKFPKSNTYSKAFFFSTVFSILGLKCFMNICLKGAFVFLIYFNIHFVIFNIAKPAS